MEEIRAPMIIPNETMEERWKWKENEIAQPAEEVNKIFNF